MTRMIPVAWRNVFRHRRRSALVITALTVGIWIMVLGMGWVQGYHTYLYDAVIDYDTGHLQVHADGYLDEAGRYPLDLTLPSYGGLRTRIEAVDGVEAAAGRIDFSVEVSDGSRSLRAVGRAIDPDAERQVTVIDDRISRGTYFRDGGVLIGAPMAERLEVGPGDVVFLTAVDRGGRRNVIDRQIDGTFRFGYPTLDERVVFADLASAQELLALGDEVTRVVVAAEPGRDLERLAVRIESSVARWERHETEAEVRPWTRFAETTVQAVRMDTVSFTIVLGILFLLIFLGILNAMSMAVQERTAEIATLRAIGMRQGAIVRLLFSEAALIGLLGAAAGIVWTLPFVGWLETVGVDIGSILPERLPIPFGERFHADFRLWHFLLAAGASSVVAALGSVLPARRAGNVNLASTLQGRGRQ